MLKVSTGVEVFLESQLRFVCPLSDHVALQGICPIVTKMAQLC